MIKLLKLSVVIIGRNEGERLVRCIQSVQAMAGITAAEMEIIYVDSDSTDNSVQRAQELGVEVLQVSPTRPSAATGRNAGWQAAKAEYVLFLDGDTILNANFAISALSYLQADETIAIVWGHRRELYPQHSIYQRVLDLDWLYPAGLSDFCGGDALMRKKVLTEVNGYNAELIAGEEPEMCQRIRAKGYSILHLDIPMTWHDLAMTNWRQYWRRAVRAGHAYAEIAQLFKHTGMPLWAHEARRNWQQAGFWLLLILFSLSGIYFMSFLPLLFSLGIFFGLSIRTAWRYRWKSSNFITLLLYGMHSHFQQIPIAVGQIIYHYQHWLGKRQDLIEYKKS